MPYTGFATPFSPNTWAPSRPAGGRGRREAGGTLPGLPGLPAPFGGGGGSWPGPLPGPRPPRPPRRPRRPAPLPPGGYPPPLGYYGEQPEIPGKRPPLGQYPPPDYGEYPGGYTLPGPKPPWPYPTGGAAGFADMFPPALYAPPPPIVGPTATPTAGEYLIPPPPGWTPDQGPYWDMDDLRWIWETFGQPGMFQPNAPVMPMWPIDESENWPGGVIPPEVLGGQPPYTVPTASPFPRGARVRR